MLKHKIATVPILRQFNPTREAVIIDYASEWAIFGVSSTISRRTAYAGDLYKPDPLS